MRVRDDFIGLSCTNVLCGVQMWVSGVGGLFLRFMFFREARRVVFHCCFWGDEDLNAWSLFFVLCAERDILCWWQIFLGWLIYRCTHARVCARAYG